VKALPPEKFDQYIDQPGREKDFKALEALYRADFALDPTQKGYHSNYAAMVYCRNLDPERAVAFCASLDLGSSAWAAALIGLRDHPRAKVIGYIKQVATSSIPWVPGRPAFALARRAAHRPADDWAADALMPAEPSDEGEAAAWARTNRLPYQVAGKRLPAGSRRRYRTACPVASVAAHAAPIRLPAGDLARFETSTSYIRSPGSAILRPE
jgi:hypothetical protein